MKGAHASSMLRMSTDTLWEIFERLNDAFDKECFQHRINRLPSMVFV